MCEFSLLVTGPHIRVEGDHFDADICGSNDAVVPINGSHPGCPADKDGLCAFDNVVDVLLKRSAEIDYNYDCLANYTASPGVNYNGRAPKA